MPITPVPTVALTPVAYFPEKYFLETWPCAATVRC